MAAEDPAADSFFAEETSAHYTEHTEQIAAFADGLERPPA
jgi:hypothetical protein